MQNNRHFHGPKHLFSSRSGFTLPELIFSIIILGTILTFTLNVYFQTLTANANLTEYNRLQSLLTKKMASIESLGFWIWEGTSTGNYLETHPMSIWKASLASDNYTGISQMDVVFLKRENRELIPFDGDEFDGNKARKRVNISLKLVSSKNGVVSQNKTLIIPRNSEKHAWTQLFIIKQALLMYEEDNGVFPQSSTWASDLVPDYIVEIPNNPYTRESRKITHIEDAVDWHYDNNSGSITLAAQTHLSTITHSF